MDYNFVTPRLATGGALTSADDARALFDAGVTHVIDCRQELDDAMFFATLPKLSYLFCPTGDDGTPKPPEWFKPGIEFGLGALAHSGNKVYAHCAAGVNRGPSMAYAILRAFGYSAALAEGVIRTARPQVGLRYKGDADSAVLALGYL